MWCVDQPVHLVKALQTAYIFESREFDQLIRWEGKWFNIDSTGPTRNSESESENEMRIQCKHQKTWGKLQCQTLDFATVWRKIH